MKKYLLVLVILFLTLNCNKKIKEKEFDFFEISYTNGWNGSFSFAIIDNSKFYYKTVYGHIKGKLTDQEYDELQKGILEIRNANLKSNTGNCVDCSSFSLMIKNKSEISHIIQNGEIDKEIDKVAKTVKKIVMNKEIDSLDLRYNFQTERDLIEPPPSRMPANISTGN